MGQAKPKKTRSGERGRPCVQQERPLDGRIGLFMGRGIVKLLQQLGVDATKPWRRKPHENNQKNPLAVRYRHLA
jgi:hypothetical protein